MGGEGIDTCSAIDQLSGLSWRGSTDPGFFCFYFPGGGEGQTQNEAFYLGQDKVEHRTVTKALALSGQNKITRRSLV